jgi:hypothetical protein
MGDYEPTPGGGWRRKRHLSLPGSWRRVSIFEMDAQGYRHLYEEVPVGTEGSEDGIRVATGWTSEANLDKVRSFTPTDERITSNRKFYGRTTKTKRKALDLFDKGWAKGAERCESLAAELHPPMARGVRRRATWQDQGCEVDITRVWSGQLDQAWRGRSRAVTQAPRILAVDVEIGGNKDTNEEQLFYSGAAAVVLTDVLERAGYRVELRAVMAHGANAGYGENLALTRILIKEAHQPADLALIAAVCCHPGTFRTLGFAALSANLSDLGWGFGTISSARDLINTMVAAGHLTPSDIFVPHSYSESMARRAIKSAIDLIEKEQGSASGD